MTARAIYVPLTIEAALANQIVAVAVISKCLASGVVVESGGKEGDVLKLMPPINIEPSLMQSGLDRLDTVLGSI